MTYQMGEPMKWEQFKQMPPELQKQYISGLQERFGVNATSLSEMFGITALTVRRHAAANHLGLVFPVGKSMTKEQRASWNAFIGIAEETAPEQEEEAPAVKLSAKIREPEPGEGMAMNHVCLRFSGEINIAGIANSLRLILGDYPVGQVEIICELK